MGDTRDPDRDQVAPTSRCMTCGDVCHWQECPTGGWWIHENHPEDDHDAVVYPSVTDLVIADLEERREYGVRKYGVALQPHNGRDPRRDLYEELLDAALYARQMLYEDGVPTIDYTEARALVAKLYTAAHKSENGGGEWYQLIHRCREAAEFITRLLPRG